MTGRGCNVEEPYRMEDAEYAVVGMGSMIEICEATVDYLREAKGLKVGAIHVTCFRPFPGAQLVETLKDVKASAVKIIATISGDLSGIDAQAYPKYSSEKTGLPTTYYLTLANEPVRVQSELNVVGFIPLNNENAFLTGNPLVGLCEAGTVFIQSTQTTLGDPG